MNKQQIKHLFASYPDQSEFYIASDGSAYLYAGAAMEYAERAKLEDQTISTVTRAEMMAWETKPASAKPTTAPVKNPAVSAPVANAEATTPVQKHIVTQEDLGTNPDLVAQGVKVGEEITFEGTESTPAAPLAEKEKQTAKSTEKAPAKPATKKATAKKDEK